MERDIILILEEGTTLGVFGAGVLTAFSEKNLYPRIQSIYASSCGSHNAAYFLSQQAKLGSSIYYEDLIGEKFIKRRNFWPFIKDVFIAKIVLNKPIKSVVDINYLLNIEETTKRLDIEKIKNQPINFYARVYDLKKSDWVYLDGKKDTFKVLKATASSPPFYPHSVEINKQEYIDGSGIRTKKFLKIIKDNPDKKIIYVINRKKTYGRTFGRLSVDLFQSFLLALIFGFKVGFKKMVSVFKFIPVNELKTYPNVIVAANNNTRIPGSSTDKEELLVLYKEGLRQGYQILEKI